MTGADGARLPEQPVAIRGDTIRLGQLLKLAGLVTSGAQARALLAAAPALVNGEPEARRGRQLHPGDQVIVADVALRVTGLSEPAREDGG
ncbi:MAG: RNA-binding S4 domain-containing protein [Solirubrobacteraceae bacterium]